MWGRTLPHRAESARPSASTSRTASQADGPQPEEALRGLLDRLTLSSSDGLQDQLGALLEAEDFETAGQLLKEAIAEEPNNQTFRVELADLLIRQGNLDDARTVLTGIPEETDERDRPVQRLEFAEEAAALDSHETLNARLADDDEDLQTRYQLAVTLVVAGDCQGALDQAMTILQTDREFEDDLGRKTMLRIFSLLGKGSELASSYRRRMFNFMH